MKNVFVAVALSALAAGSAAAQGLVNFANNNNSATKISTNSVPGGAATGLITGAGNYRFALFYSATAMSVNGQTAAIVGPGPIGSGPTFSLYAFNDSAWNFAGYATNTGTAGRLNGGQIVVPGIADGGTAQFVVIGWSANIGPDIPSVIAWANSFNPANGQIGQSAVSGPILLGDGNQIPTPILFGTSSPDIQGFTLGYCALDVDGPPSITTQPADVTVPVGGTATFSVTANGSPPPVYTWYFPGALGLSCSCSSLTITNVQLTNAGSYGVFVYNQLGGVWSSNAMLTVISPDVSPPTILIQPTSVSVAVGDSATFAVTASGAAPLTYQWIFNGTNLAGATNNTLSLSNIQPANAGNYFGNITNAYGATNTAVVVLTVIPPDVSPPTILIQPTSVSVAVGDSATFAATASGAAPLSYQWNFNGTNLVGATNNTLSLSNIQPANAGNYFGNITNAYGATNTAVVVLTVKTNCPPFITAQPQNLSVLLGAPATFSVTATGTLPMSYQWSFNDTNLIGATNSSLIIASVQATNTGSYAVTVANAYGSTNSASATLTIVQPSGGYVIFGNNNNSATKIFTNSAVGGPPTGLTATNPGLYYYALYASATATSVSGRTNAILGNAGTSYAFYDGNWMLVAYGKNSSIRGRLVSTSTDDYGDTLVGGFPGGSFAQFVVIGWSANIGTNTWALQSWFNAGSPASDGWIGQSGVSGALQLGDGAIIPAVNLFGSSAPFLQGFTLGLASPNPAASYPPPNVPPPILTTALAGGSIRLSWPVFYNSYGVQSAGSPAGPWSDLVATPVSDGTNWNVTISTANQQPFYRLIVK